MSWIDTEGREGPPSLSAKRRVGAFLVLLLLLAAAMALVHRYYLVQPDWRKVAGGDDHYRYFGALGYYMDFWQGEGETALWNPMTLCGTPVAGSPQLMQFYPPNALRSYACAGSSPLATLLGLLLLSFVHLYSAGVGAYCLGRRHGLSFPAASLAGFMFASSPALAARLLQHPNILMVCSWFPWILLSLNHACSARSWRGRAAYALAAGLVSALSFMAGFPDCSVNVGVGALVYVVALRACRHLGAPAASSLARGLLQDVLVLGLVALVTVCCSAVLLVPAGILFAESPRAAEAGHDIYRLEQLFQPHKDYPPYWDLRYFVSSNILFAARRVISRDLRGLGSLAWGLVAMALLGRRRAAVGIFAAVFLALTDCSMGPPLPISTLVRAVCPWEQGWPFRALVPLALPLAMLAGSGLDALVDPARSRKRACVEGAVLAAVGLGCLAVTWHGIRHLTQADVSMWGFGFPLLGFALVAGWRVVAPCEGARPTWRTGSRMVVAGLVWGLVACEFAVWTPAYQAFSVNRFSSLPFDADSLRLRHPYLSGNSRRAVETPCLNLYDMQRAINGYEPFGLAGVRDFVMGATGDSGTERALIRTVSAVRTSRTHHYGNLLLKRRFWLARQYVRGSDFDPHTLFPPTTTTYLPEGEAPSLPVLEAAPRHAVSAGAQPRPLPIPRAARTTRLPARQEKAAHQFTLREVDIGPVHSALRLTCVSTCRARIRGAVAPKGQSLRYLLAELNLAPSEEAQSLECALPDVERGDLKFEILLRDGPGRFEILDAVLLGDPNDEDERIAFISDTPNEVEVEVRDLPGPRILTYLDADFPGWEVRVDGEKAAMLHPFGLFKGVALPPGTHRVTFVFRPRYFCVAMAASVLSVLLTAIGIAVLCRRRRGNSRASKAL